ncbi:hypothetical protein [Cytobacillus oceanisediminis]|uniref:Uncharacterized protein n=1 Tax=Cytobacillus oceanisediminis TaxID=665099 RepID=A0ABX3CLG5_9BACI|nr:hypothetical protein [Cytobacillus oceanisediminis]OHX42349.1 hypothetical protein BBV17_27515 [Cytobacillus oceanisediminis]
MKFREVTVKDIWQGEVCEEYPEKGIYYEDHGKVIRCDQWGAVSINYAKPVEGTDIVLVEERAKDLLEDNQALFISLIMSGGAAK